VNQINSRTQDRRWSDDPTAWFITLQRARSQRDEDLEAVALRELARLGVHVTITSARPREVRP